MHVSLCSFDINQRRFCRVVERAILPDISSESFYARRFLLVKACYHLRYALVEGNSYKSYASIRRRNDGCLGRCSLHGVKSK
jgi:hypothetical protein